RHVAIGGVDEHVGAGEAVAQTNGRAVVPDRMTILGGVRIETGGSRGVVGPGEKGEEAVRRLRAAAKGQGCRHVRSPWKVCCSYEAPVSLKSVFSQLGTVCVAR